MGRLEGKVALVTGGAMGIGEAIVRMFIAEGARVVIADISEEAGRRLAAPFADAARFEPLDVSDELSWENVIAATASGFERLDILVNNAGVVEAGSIEETTSISWRRMFAVNVDGPFLGCRAAIPLMKVQGGSIINIASAMGLRPYATLAGYCASKSAVTMLTKSVALHCAEQKYGIRCNSIHPGSVHTPLLESFLAAAPDPEAALQGYTSLIPLGRLGKPEEIAAAATFLASDEAAFVSGCEMTVDGALAIG